MSDNAKDGGPAKTDWERSAAKMSLRDWFAGQALVGIALADARNGSSYASPDDPTLAWCAEHAYQLADAMLIERDKPNPAA
jgi:hypothetical protein